MTNICDACGKGKMKGNKISITRSQVSRRTNKHYQPNIQKVTLTNEGGNKQSIHLCTKCMKTLKQA